VQYSLQTALTNAIIFTGESFVENHTLLINNDKIVDLVQNSNIPDNYKIESCANNILSPAFIDCQINGGGNILFNNSPTKDSILQIAKAHRKTGTTRFLPTCITDTPEITKKAINAMREAKKEDNSVIGIHIEGPHINKEKKGMHFADLIREMENKDFDLYKKNNDEIFVITVAPEIVSPQYIKKLKENGLKISLGHSKATISQTQDALNAGANCFTHLFNAMPKLSGRDGGIASVAISDPKSFCGIILDGHHISPEMVRVACAAKPKDKLFMVSDAIAPSGATKAKEFKYNNKIFYPKDGVCKDENGMLAGALKTLGQCVPTAIKELLLDPERVLQMASTIPASFLGIDDKFGKLLPNYTADIVSLDHNFKTVSVWKDGKKED